MDLKWKAQSTSVHESPLPLRYTASPGFYCLWEVVYRDERGYCLQATYKDFANKLYGTNEIANSSRFSKPKRDQTGFTIEHYAGAVTYRTENFLNKNKDFVVAEHQQLMQNSSVQFVRGLFPPEVEDTQPQKVGLQYLAYRVADAFEAET